MELLGYTDRLSAAPGESVRFMISAEVASYDLRIERFVGADRRPHGPTFRTEPVATPANGRYAGRRQTNHAGSYITVPDHEVLRDLEGLTIQAWIFPTTPRHGKVQGLVAKWLETGAITALAGLDVTALIARAARGFALVIAEDGTLALRLADAGGRSSEVRSSSALRADQWYAVAATFDGVSGRATLRQESLIHWPFDEQGAVVERNLEVGAPAAHDGPLTIAALMPPAAGLYNGKIDRPRLFRRALSPEEVTRLLRGAAPASVAAADLVASWDFSREMSTTRAVDTSPHGLHGRLVNMPARAMTGYNWTAETTDPAKAPEQYGAICFHDDDVDDAGWQPDLELAVPAGLPSGVYAAHITSSGGASTAHRPPPFHGGIHRPPYGGRAVEPGRGGSLVDDYVPFYVRPPRGAATAPMAFLAPTISYLAYGNERLFNLPDVVALSDQAFTLGRYDKYLDAHAELGMSLYDHHTDDTGVCYSSRLRPILTMRPDWRNWMTGAPRHFSADLFLVEWLLRKGYRHDVVTDEDLHHEGAALLAPYRVVLTGSHPEYWTAPMMAGLEGYLAGGGRLMYLGGNGFYWVTSMAPHRSHLVEVRRGYAGTRNWSSRPGETHHSTTGEEGGLWRHRGKAPQQLVGIGCTGQGWGSAAPFRRLADSHNPRATFIFAGIGPDEAIGDFGMVHGAAGDELDRQDRAQGTPPHALLLATSAGTHPNQFQCTVEDIPQHVPGRGPGGAENPLVRADMTYFEGPNGGAVFAAGSINWCATLEHNDFDNNVSRLTDNVVRRFVSPDPL
jgi:N,N-dimethylformamidase